MSGIYIPGIEMPKSCDKCVHPTCTLWQFVNGGERHEKCPIIYVLQHGRIIDADEFLQRALGTRCFHGDYARMLEELVAESKTVIPAEGKP